MSVALVLTERPIAEDEVQIVDDLDSVIETVMCSCNAGDANPY